MLGRRPGGRPRAPRFAVLRIARRSFWRCRPLERGRLPAHQREGERRNYFRQEIDYGAFQRSIPLPVEVNAAKASAELKNGMLKVTLPKSKQPKAHEVKVAAG